jgi:hypothetical protein
MSIEIVTPGPDHRITGVDAGGGGRECIIDDRDIGHGGDGGRRLGKEHDSDTSKEQFKKVFDCFHGRINPLLVTQTFFFQLGPQ